MRLPKIEHQIRPWRIHELATMRSEGGLNQNTPVVRLLFALPWKLGALVGWDRPEPGYLAAVKPVRRPIVYPALTRTLERTWRRRHRAGSRHGGRTEMIKWAGRLIVLYGAAHTLGALTAEGAARHAGAWFSGKLWGEDLADMSPAMSAYWLSVNSFGPPLILLGLTVLWLDRRGITPPPFIAWVLAGWVVLGVVVAGPGIGQDLILLVAAGLVLAGARRAASDRATQRPPQARAV